MVSSLRNDEMMKMFMAAILAFAAYQVFFNKGGGGMNFMGCSASRQTGGPAYQEYFTPPNLSKNTLGSPVGQVGGDAIETRPQCGQSSQQFIATNMLPKEDPKMRDWGEFAPKGALQGQDMLLEPEQCIGQDTVSNHLRNASYDLRAEPPNPLKSVSPWINTTMGPDLMRRPLEDCNMMTVNQK